MLPFIIIGIVALFTVAVISSFREDPELAEIKDDKIFQDFMIDTDEEDIGIRIIKQRTTRAINKLIPNFNGYKIGKSGNPKARNSNHKKYSQMFILCKSKDGDLINELESYYNSKYIDDPANDNLKEGSAGEAVPYGKHYYLYVALR